MKTDIEILLQFSQPVRKYDTITIRVPKEFKLSSLTAQSVQSHFGGYAPYSDEYLGGSETWTGNRFYGAKPMMNFTGFEGSYYAAVSADREKYQIPQAFVLDHTLKGNEITIFGLMSDNDPRKTVDGQVDSKTMLIRIMNVFNPN